MSIPMILKNIGDSKVFINKSLIGLTSEKIEKLIFPAVKNYN